MSNVFKLIQLGLLDPRAKLSQKIIDNAQARYDNLIKNPWYREQVALLESGGFENKFEPAQLADRPVIMPEDLAGNALVSYKTDRSNVGKIKKVSGLDVNVDAQGGGKFPLTHPDFGWMSMGGEDGKIGIAERAHRNAQLTSSLTGRPVTATNNLMGVDSSNFSTPVSELMYALINQGRIPKGLLDELDQRILKAQGATARKENPFVGIQSQDALAQLMGQGGHSMYGAGALRHAFLSSLSQPEMRDLGFPQPRVALPVYDDPMYTGLPTGTTGFNMWTPDVDREVVNAIGTHNSYSTGFPKKVDALHGARYPVEISWEAQNPKLVRELEGAMTEPKYDKKKGTWSTPRLLTRNEKMNATMDRTAGLDNATIQIMDQEAIDSASKAIEHNLNLKKVYGSLAAALAAGETMADEGGAKPNFADEADFRRLLTDLYQRQRFLNPDRGGDVGSISGPEPDLNKAAFYENANTLMGQVGQTYKNMGVPAGLVDFFTPDYSSRVEQALGNDSLWNKVQNVLSGIDPTEAAPYYGGLLGEYIRSKR